MAFAQYPTMQTVGAAGAYQTMGAPMMTSMAAPQMTYGATTMAAPQMTYGATTMAAPQVTYGAPMMQAISAPAVEYVQAAPQVTYASAPQVTYAAPAVEIDQVNAFGQVVERDFVVQAGPRNLLAMGNVISERVITIEELAANDRYDAAEAVMVAPAVLEIDRVNTFGQVVERDFVGAAPLVQTMAAPAAQYVTAAPQMTYGAPIMQTMAAPAVEFVGAAPVTYAAAPTTAAYGASSFAAPVTAAYGGASTYGAPTTSTYGGASTFAAPMTAAYGGNSTYAAPMTSFGASSFPAPVSTVI